jgi:hypothetical protein
MNIKRVLTSVMKIIVEEAARNPEFEAQLHEALDANRKPQPTRLASSSVTETLEPKVRQKEEAKRRGGRRAAALLDPVAIVERGEEELRKQLSILDLEMLHDIVAQYGMDPGKLVMKWKDRDRVIGRIVEIAAARATKGDAFRKD